MNCKVRITLCVCFFKKVGVIITSWKKNFFFEEKVKFFFFTSLKVAFILNILQCSVLFTDDTVIAAQTSTFEQKNAWFQWL